MVFFVMGVVFLQSYDFSLSSLKLILKLLNIGFKELIRLLNFDQLGFFLLHGFVHNLELLDS